LAILHHLREFVEKRHVMLDDSFEHLKSPPLLPVGDIALDFPHPGILRTR
jgi:hypothetical protein